MLEGWQKLRATPEEVPGLWHGDQNVGLILGPSGLVCVDGDVPMAAQFMRAGLLTALLGTKTLMGGRAGNPASHAFYRVNGEVKHKSHYDIQPKDPNEKKRPVVELLAGNHQVLVAPSVQPTSGETYDWNGDEYDASKIATVEVDDLVWATKMLFTMAIVAGHMPAGGRHTLALALAGLMRRDDRLTRGDVERIFKAAWRVVWRPGGRRTQRP